MHETIPLQILDPFTELFEVGHTVSAHGSNAQIVAWVNERSVAQDVRSVVLFHFWISQTMSLFWHRTDVSIPPPDVSFEEKNRRTGPRMIQTGS